MTLHAGMSSIAAAGLAGLLLSTSNDRDPPFRLDDLPNLSMTFAGRHHGAPATATYSVQHEECDAAKCLHILWQASFNRIESWVRPDGRPIRSVCNKIETGEDIVIAYTMDGAIYRYHKQGTSKTTTVQRPGLVEVLVIDIMLLAYPFDHPRRIEFPIINTDSDDGTTYTMYAELTGVETLTVAGAKIEAYKITLGLTGLFGAFAPDLFFWYSVRAPHRYLKYQGPDESFELSGGG